MRSGRLTMAAVMAAALAGCSNANHHVGRPLATPGLMATAILHGADGRTVGRAVAQEVEGGLRLSLDAQGLLPGQHGVHVHTVGRCDPPDFTSAGGHWNPLGTHHGANNPAGPHMGDLPNLDINTDGHGSIAVNVPGATMAGLLDSDGSAIVIHAGPDDLMSDPAGNSGPRVACGVFMPG
ncbi:MAG: superoxide dismutase family protein [Sphingomonas sp.]